MRTKRRLREEEIEPHIRDNRIMKTKIEQNIYYQVFIPTDCYGTHMHETKHLNKQFNTLQDARDFRDNWIKLHYERATSVGITATLPYWFPQ